MLLFYPYLVLLTIYYTYCFIFYFQRMKVGLSSACLLVEAAVGPLETTFKFPKTKKTIMNEWLNKSPERNLGYEFGSPLEFSNATDNNNSSHPFAEKHTFLGGKSIENLVRVANTMIGSLSGGVISADSTPEKSCVGQQSEPETADSSCSPSPIDSSLTFSQKAVKRVAVARDLSKDAVGFSPERNRTPKKMRKFLRVPSDPSPLKRSLRSSAVISSTGISQETEEEEPEPCPISMVPPGGLSPPPAQPPLAPHPHLMPPQHSAKKRWLRQAISEESDSPTAGNKYYYITYYVHSF